MPEIQSPKKEKVMGNVCYEKKYIYFNFLKIFLSLLESQIYRQEERKKYTRYRPWLFMGQFFISKAKELMSFREKFFLKSGNTQRCDTVPWAGSLPQMPTAAAIVHRL